MIDDISMVADRMFMEISTNLRTVLEFSWEIGRQNYSGTPLISPQLFWIPCNFKPKPISLGFALVFSVIYCIIGSFFVQTHCFFELISVSVSLKLTQIILNSTVWVEIWTSTWHHIMLEHSRKNTIWAFISLKSCNDRVQLYQYFWPTFSPKLYPDYKDLTLTICLPATEATTVF